MNKLFIAGAVAALAASNASALSAGDIAFTSFNADEDGFSIVALTNLPSNTNIFFTDNTWNGTAFANTEMAHRWNTGATGVNAGTVVRFSAVDVVASAAASVGTLTFSSSANLGFNATNETVYAYTSATNSFLAPTTFLAAISNAPSGFGNATYGVLTGTGLSVGTSAIALNSSADYGVYNGARSGAASFANYGPLVNTLANWTVDTTNGNYTTTVPNITAFTITPVPEPETYALMLAGLAAVGTIVRRRRGA